MGDRKVELRPLLLHGLLVAAGLLPGSAVALGLGAIQVKSALSQPFEAEIELVQDRPGEADLANVALASSEAFQRAGLERRFFLSGLTFSVERRGNGSAYVRVRSTEPVREPYLDFLVEAVWPGGNLQRQYTVLLDPPARPWAGMVDPALSSAPPPMRASSVQSGPAATSPAAAPWPRVDPFAGVGAVTPGSAYGPVRPGDTLWKIAARARPPGVSQAQAMAAIVRANSGAFLGGDPNRLMAGSTLTIPGAAELGAGTHSDARAAMAPFIPGWAAAAPAPASVATAESEAQTGGPVETAAESGADAAPATAGGADPAGAELRLVQADTPAGAGGAATANDVLLLEESLDATRQENAALRARLEALEAQVAALSQAIGAPGDGAGPLAQGPDAGSVTPDTGGAPADGVAPAGADPAQDVAGGGIDAAVPAPGAQAASAAESPPAPTPTPDSAGRQRTIVLATVAAGLAGGFGLLMARRRGREARAAHPEPAVAVATAAPVRAPVAAAPKEIEVTGLPDFDEMPGTDAAASRLDLLAAMLAARNTDGAREVYAEIVASGDAGTRAQADALMHGHA